MDDEIILVGMRVKGPLMFPDNLTGPCAECGHMVQYRPHAPKFVKLLCLGCAADLIGPGDEITTTPQMLEDAKTYERRKKAMKIKWLDGNREPKQLANKLFPDGIDVDLSNGQKGCTVALPYPAKRVGHYYVECEVCGVNALITTAGRSDDPRSIRMPCK